jgi:hypothetical protein
MSRRPHGRYRNARIRATERRAFAVANVTHRLRQMAPNADPKDTSRVTKAIIAGLAALAKI